MKYKLLEGSTALKPGFKHQLGPELIEQLELELPCLVALLQCEKNKRVNEEICSLTIPKARFGAVDNNETKAKARWSDDDSA